MTSTFFFSGFDRIFFARSHSLKAWGEGFWHFFFYKENCQNPLLCALSTFSFSQFFLSFFGFFFQFFAKPRVRAVLLLYSKTSVSHCSPPHPPSVGLKTHRGWVGGCGGVEVSRPLPGQCANLRTHVTLAARPAPSLPARSAAGLAARVTCVRSLDVAG